MPIVYFSARRYRFTLRFLKKCAFRYRGNTNRRQKFGFSKKMMRFYKKFVWIGQKNGLGEPKLRF